MKLLAVCLLLSIVACVFSWEYPGYPGVDCPTARKGMSDGDVDTQWVLPECNADGTFRDMQCFPNPKGDKDKCFCVAPDGSPLTLPGFGLDVKSCLCFMDQYNIFEHKHNDEMPKCERDGHYTPLQCSKTSGTCWCVDGLGNVLVPPSPDVHSCANDHEH